MLLKFVSHVNSFALETKSGNNCNSNSNGVAKGQDVNHDQSGKQSIPLPHYSSQHQQQQHQKQVHQQQQQQQQQVHQQYQQQVQQQYQQQVQHLNNQNIQRKSTLSSEGLSYNQQRPRSPSTTPSYSNSEHYKQGPHSNNQHQQLRYQNNIATSHNSTFDQVGSTLPPSQQQLRQYEQNHKQQPQQPQYNTHNAYNNASPSNPGLNYNQQGVHSNSVPHSYSNRQSYQHQQKQTEGYKFGDFTKGIVNKGKKARGKDESSGYKFGDFTRGLFK